MRLARAYLTAVQALPLVAFLLLWQGAVTFVPRWKFFFGSPLEILHHLVSRSLDGSLLTDTGITAAEAALGFITGTVLGTSIGIGLWMSRIAFVISRPYVIALGSAPVFALAPVIIVWVGTGFFSKVVIAGLSTVFVAQAQAYNGALEADEQHSMLFKSLGASKLQILRKAIAPGAMVWVISGLRLNVGFALLGAFIGEFISSSDGLGHMILVASGLFKMSLVLAGVITFVLVALAMNLLISATEPLLRAWVARYL
jgi:NitT/TauT family transport system permease protein